MVEVQYCFAAKISEILSDTTRCQPDVQHDEARYFGGERKRIHRCRNQLPHLCIHEYVFWLLLWRIV